MKQFINNLRARPEHHRRHILHVSTMVVAGVMVLLWFVSLGHSLTDSDVHKKVSQDAKPLSALKANLLDGYNSISEPTTGSDLQ